MPVNAGQRRSTPVMPTAFIVTTIAANKGRREKGEGAPQYGLFVRYLTNL